MRMSLCMCTISLLVLISTVTVQAHIYSFFLLTIVLMFVNNLTAGKLNRKFYRVSTQNPCTIAAIDWLKIKGYFIVVVLQHQHLDAHHCYCASHDHKWSAKMHKWCKYNFESLNNFRNSCLPVLYCTNNWCL